MMNYSPHIYCLPSSMLLLADDNELMFQAQPCNAIWVEAWEPLNAADDVLEQVLQLLLCMVSREQARMIARMRARSLFVCSVGRR